MKLTAEIGMWPGWLCLEQSVSLEILDLVNVGFLLIGACVGYILSAGRESWSSSAFQLAVFLCAWCFYSYGLFSNRIHSLFIDLDYCLSVFDEMSLRPHTNGRRGKIGSNGMSDWWMVLDLLGSNPASSFCWLVVSIQQILLGWEKTHRNPLLANADICLGREVFVHNYECQKDTKPVVLSLTEALLCCY